MQIRKLDRNFRSEDSGRAVYAKLRLMILTTACAFTASTGVVRNAHANVFYTQAVPEYVKPHISASLNEICPRVFEIENPPVITVRTFQRRFGVMVYSCSFAKGDVAFEFDLLADTINRTVTGLTVNREDNCI